MRGRVAMSIPEPVSLTVNMMYRPGANHSVISFLASPSCTPGRAARLKKPVADLSVDKDMLQLVIRKDSLGS
jgi:hypothetical protein